MKRNNLVYILLKWDVGMFKKKKKKKVGKYRSLCTYPIKNKNLSKWKILTSVFELFFSRIKKMKKIERQF